LIFIRVVNRLAVSKRLMRTRPPSQTAKEQGKSMQKISLLLALMFTLPYTNTLSAAPLGPVADSSQFGSQTAMARPLPYSQKHIDWCLRNHTGYQASDNTYDYSRHFRKQCSSPYYRAPDTRLRS